MKMRGVYLPGNRQVTFKEVDVPEPGHGQVLIKMKASSICGSDIRAIYREHLGHGPEAYQNVIAGHEPCGQIVKVGARLQTLQGGRPRHSLPHQRLWRLQRLPRRLHDLLHLRPPRRLRLAAGRRSRRLSVWPRRVPAWRCPTS